MTKDGNSKESPVYYPAPSGSEQKNSAELEAGRMNGPFSKLFQYYIVSPLTVCQKTDPSKYRLIHDLAQPKDRILVNGNTAEEKCEVHYADIQKAISLIQVREQSSQREM